MLGPRKILMDWEYGGLVKTEIARRLSKMMRLPFYKRWRLVKYTRKLDLSEEDVESMIRRF